MWVGGQWWGADVIDRIKDFVTTQPSVSRRALSRQVCEWLEWRDAMGRLCEGGARKALVELGRRGAIGLPEARAVENFRRRALAESPAVEIGKLECSLVELGPVEVVAVRSRRDSATWTYLIETYHYLGACKQRGAQMRYLIRSTVYGTLGALSLCAGTRRLRCRDEWIGWGDGACRANLQQVATNNRFLILPGVKVPNLASHVLGHMLRRISSDWQQRYGYELVLVETFVDPERFDGVCYRAANWERIGQTAGRNDGFANKKVSTGKKDVYVYTLRDDARQVLCREPDDKLKRRGQLTGAADWVEQELATARIFDNRLRQRMYRVSRNFAAQFQTPIPQAGNGSMAEAKATYRFFKNRRVTMEGMLKGHVEASIERAREHAIVLSAQDTTYLNYTAHCPEGAGPIGPTRDVGLILHASVAFTPRGTPLGVLDAQCWTRDPKRKGKRHERDKLPIEEKETAVWLRGYRAVAEVQRLCPQTKFVVMGDRESDLFELFAEAAATPDGPHLLVRAERTRHRKTLDDDGRENDGSMWDQMQAEPLVGYQELHIPKRGATPARKATIAIRRAKVVLRPPARSKLDPVQIWAVYAVEEISAAAVRDPIEWMLLTTVPVITFDDAIERLSWYTQRWGIELFHRILKSGCRIEDRLLDDIESIKKCLALDLVVAWRIHQLMKASRETPDVPCTEYFESDEWKLLHAVVHNQSPPQTPPSLRTAVHMTARLGGFLGRTRDGDPGMITLWRGLIRLNAMVYGARAALRHMAPPIGPP